MIILNPPNMKPWQVTYIHFLYSTSVPIDWVQEINIIGKRFSGDQFYTPVLALLLDVY